MNRDTTQEADVRQHEIFKRMEGGEKVRIALGLSDVVRDLALEGLKRRYPEASESERRILFIKEIYGVQPTEFSREKRHG